MKSLLIATAVLAAMPLVAADPPAAPLESPLAAAARKSKRNDGRKRIVITNESLKHSKGHISISNTQTELPQVKPLPTPKTEKELIADQASAKAAQAKKLAAERRAKDAELKRLERMARAAEMAEGEEVGYGEEDPAQAERQMEDAARRSPPR